MKVQRQIDQLLAQRAAEWIETLKSGDERDRAAFVEWLRQSKLHVEQYLELVAIERELQRLDPAVGEDVNELLKRIAPNVVPLKPAGPVQHQIAGISGRRRIWGVAAALAASIALCGVGILWRIEALKLRHEFTTAVGEQRTLSLDDGSLVTLNVASSMRVDFSPTIRNIDLKDGEAVFQVAHDKNRPFVVHTSTATIRAVGTQFNVDQRSDGTVVSVLEGRVFIAALHPESAQNQANTQNLNTGEEAQIAPDGRIELRSHPDVHKATAWRQRKLIFDETPLEDIAQEFHRYETSVKITLEGIAPGSRRYGGIFDANDPQSLIDLLSREPDIVVEHRDGEIVIRKR